MQRSQGERHNIESRALCYMSVGYWQPPYAVQDIAVASYVVRFHSRTRITEQSD